MCASHCSCTRCVCSLACCDGLNTDNSFHCSLHLVAFKINSNRCHRYTFTINICRPVSGSQWAIKCSYFLFTFLFIFNSKPLYPNLHVLMISSFCFLIFLSTTSSIHTSNLPSLTLAVNAFPCDQLRPRN